MCCFWLRWYCSVVVILTQDSWLWLVTSRSPFGGSKQISKWCNCEAWNRSDRWQIWITPQSQFAPYWNSHFKAVLIIRFGCLCTSRECSAAESRKFMQKFFLNYAPCVSTILWTQSGGRGWALALFANIHPQKFICTRLEAKFLFICITADII